MDFKKLYEENKDFHDFVDKTCRTYNVTVEQALTMFTVREVGMYYAENRVPHKGEVKIDCGC